MTVTLTFAESHFMKEQLNQTNRLSAGQGKVEGEQDEEDTREAELVMFDGTTQGLGLKICGGCSTDGTENFGIFVKRVLPGGLAANSGDISCGDLILEVNGQSMQNVSYDRAVTMLRHASASNHVELVVARDGDAQKEFAEYMAVFGTNQSPASGKDFVSQLSDSDAEFQRKVGTSLKDSELDAYRPGEPPGLHQGMYGDFNGHLSSSSSCVSEVANHMEDSLRPLSNGSVASRAKDSSTDYLDTLLSRKLAQDPDLKLHIDQLESAIVNLGLKLSPSTKMTLRESLTIDQYDMVKFEDFVEVTKGIFQNELGALKRSMSPKGPLELIQQGGTVLEDFAGVVRERDQLKAEVTALKEELRNCNQSSQTSEEQLLFIRKQAQSSIEEVRSLKSKLHLTEQAQAKAQQTERDYEEVVAMLENEVSQLRLQVSKSDSVSMQKRLAVLVCQLKKAESGKKTYEVATEKLIRYVEHSLEVLASLGSSTKSTGADSGGSKANKRSALQQLSTEGREVIRTVRSLMETVPLPFGWEEAYTAEGIKYYINHLNQTTTWTHPVSCMEHQTSKSPPPAFEQQAAAQADVEQQVQQQMQKQQAQQPVQMQQPQQQVQRQQPQQQMQQPQQQVQKQQPQQQMQQPQQQMQKQQPSSGQRIKLKDLVLAHAGTLSKQQQEQRQKELKDKNASHLTIEQHKQAQAAS